VCPVEEMSAQTLGTFDLVLFMGVLYHSQDPLRYLRIVRSLCSRPAYIGNAHRRARLSATGGRPAVSSRDGHSVTPKGDDLARFGRFKNIGSFRLTRMRAQRAGFRPSALAHKRA
jgi:hypothetical protein